MKSQACSNPGNPGFTGISGISGNPVTSGKPEDCTLLFDFGCILVGLSKARCIAALEKIGCGKIAYYVDECRQEDLFHELEIGGSIEDFCEEARRQSSYTDEMGVFHPCNATDEDICWAWNELLTGIPVEKLRRVKALKDMGYRTAILSNTNQIHWQKSVRDFFTIDGLTVDDYFDDIFLSCDLALVKPDKEIYEAVLEKLTPPPAPSLRRGNNTCSDTERRLDNNTEGALEDKRLNGFNSQMVASPLLGEGTREGVSILFIDDSARNCAAAEACGIRTLHDPHGDKWLTVLPSGASESSGASGLSGNPGTPGPYSAAIIGNFDGVHLGHRYLIDTLKAEAARRGLTTIAITFDRHPRTVFDPQFVGTYLTTPEEKAQLLREAGIDTVRLLPFTKELAAVSARDFMQRMCDEMGVKLLLLGYDSRFGKRTDGEGFAQYVQYGKELDMEVLQAHRATVSEASDSDVIPSSSLIRKHLFSGNIEAATACLGRRYTLRGTVIKGQQEGRKIGFPTANIAIPSDKLLPSNGVYATRVQMENGEWKMENEAGAFPENPLGAWHFPFSTPHFPFEAITNIGMRPTYNGSGITVETHIPGFSGDLYGKELCVELVSKLRDERPFSSPEELKEQIKKDLSKIKDIK